MNLNELAVEIHEIALDHGFWEASTNKGEKIALMHSELSEVLEAIRHNESPERVAEELADCIIRILDYCCYYKLDIDAALKDKMEINKSRPYLHGKKF